MSNFPDDFTYSYQPETLILWCDNDECPGEDVFRVDIPGASELGCWQADAGYDGWMPNDLAYARCPRCDEPLQEDWERPEPSRYR